MAYGSSIEKIFQLVKLNFYQHKDMIMKTRTALICAILLGFFAYSMPLLAASKAHHLEEKTVLDIPVVGKITTRTSTYLSGCKLKENTTIKLHNALVQLVSDSDGKSREIQLADLCQEVTWTLDDESGVEEKHSFAELRAIRESQREEAKTHIDIESDQNDIDDLPKMVREILGYEKNINGFKARKVLTTAYPEDSDARVIIEEYYSSKIPALSKVTSAREDLSEKLGYDESRVEGVPTLINVMYDAIRENEDWDRPEGEIVRFIIRLVDEDDDTMFSMTYDVLKAETIGYQEDHFVLK